MNIRRKLKSIKNTIIYTIAATMLLSIVFLCMTAYIYKNAEDKAFENLHMQTLVIKENINLQIKSDMENLSTMAEFASRLYSHGDSFKLVIEAFKPIGLIDAVGILKTDNTMVTKFGNIEMTEDFTFEEEVKKGTYVSGIVVDAINPTSKIIRCAVPIISDGQTVGILYGAIQPDKFREKYRELAEAQQGHLYIIDGTNGDFILDTLKNELRNMEIISEMEHKKNFTYNKMYNDIRNGQSGYTAFMSKTAGEYFYAHYAPLKVSDWNIMLSIPESVVFAEANAMQNIFVAVLAIILLIIAIYIVCIFMEEKKQSGVNLCASNTRKILLEVNQHFTRVATALKNVVVFSRARSAFFVDMEDEDYNYIAPEFSNVILTEDERKEFISLIFSYVNQKTLDSNSSVVVFDINKNNSSFSEFMEKHNFERVCVAAVADYKKHISLLGVVNPDRKSKINELLYDIAVCFSIAIYNKKYLNKVEYVAVTDGLTGLYNRVQYNRDIVNFKLKPTGNIACIYVDLNELNIINNRYGHSAGDAMIIFVAKTLETIFDGAGIYRMGGDEFLVITPNYDREKVESCVAALIEQTENMNYHISVGVEYGGVGIEEMIKKSEALMYENKAQYYLKKEKSNVSNVVDTELSMLSTGIREIDSVLSVMGAKYIGVYQVALDTDEVRSVIMSKYFQAVAKEKDCFSSEMIEYIQQMVRNDSKRAISGLLKYDILKKQLAEGYSPSVSYERIDGMSITLTVYAAPGQSDNINDTIWIFEKN